MAAVQAAEMQARDAKAQGMLTKAEMQNVLDSHVHDKDLVIPLEAKTWTIHQFALFVMSNGKLRPKWCSIPDKQDMVNNNMSSEDVEVALEHATDWILNADAVLIGSGAGMGVDSGLSTFRGRNAGVWQGLDVVGLAYEEICDPKWFNTDPELAWAFWNFCHNAYQATTPHRGYQIVRKWAEQAPLGAFSFTSNIDSHWENCGWPANRIIEVHGAVRWLQCSKDCNKEVWAAPKDLGLKEDPQTCRVSGELPRCPACNAIARPCVQMFGGDTAFCKSRRAGQIRGYDGWLNRLQARPDSKSLRLVCIELGCGLTVPTVRKELESVCRRFPGARLIRVNPEHPGLAKELQNIAVSLPLPASIALKALEPDIRLDPDEELGTYQLWDEHGNGVEVTAPMRREACRILRLAEAEKGVKVEFLKNYDTATPEISVCSLMQFGQAKDIRSTDIVPEDFFIGIKRHATTDDGDLSSSGQAEAVDGTPPAVVKISAKNRPAGAVDANQGSSICLEPLVLVTESSSWDVKPHLQFKAMWSNRGGKVVRHQLCIQLGAPETELQRSKGFDKATSPYAACAFQILSVTKRWNWRLYPKKRLNPNLRTKLNGWSAVNLLVPGDPCAVEAAQGAEDGHGKNFHILEPLGTVITICVEIALEVAEDNVHGEAEVFRPRVWYEICDTGSSSRCVDKDKPNQAQVRLALRLRGHELPEEETVRLVCRHVKFREGMCPRLKRKLPYVLQLLDACNDSFAQPEFKQKASTTKDSRRLKELVSEVHQQVLPKFGLEVRTGGQMMMTFIINQFYFAGHAEILEKVAKSMQLSYMEKVGDQIIFKVCFIGQPEQLWEVVAKNGKITRLKDILAEVRAALKWPQARVARLKFFKKGPQDSYVWLGPENCIVEELFMFEPDDETGIQWPENWRLPKEPVNAVLPRHLVSMAREHWSMFRDVQLRMSDEDRQVWARVSIEEALRIMQVFKSAPLVASVKDMSDLGKIFCYNGKALASKAMADPVLRELMEDEKTGPLMKVFFVEKPQGGPTQTGAKLFMPAAREKPTEKDNSCEQRIPARPPPGVPVDREAWDFLATELNRMSAEDWEPWSSMTLKQQGEAFFLIMSSQYAQRCSRDPVWAQAQRDQVGKSSRSHVRSDRVLRDVDRKTPRLLDAWFRRD